MRKFWLIFAILLIVNLSLQSKNVPRDKKYIEAVRTEGQLKIDGQLDEDLWAFAPVATDFSTYSPTIGEDPLYQTEVKILYDDDALYIGAMLFDKSGSPVLRELSKRDGYGANADIFWLTLNPFNDGQNIFRFEVSAANVQSDIKISPSKHDRNWNAVWESEVEITDNGWSVEMRIPYSAIRFTKEEVQSWSVNFWRLIRREREISSWNPVDRMIGSDALQAGQIVNISDIDAPLRLELYPYVSAYVANSDGGSISKSINGGLDLKYGINESFTLDMTLIPDFGQTASDQLVLNLSPYETFYGENREFFKEGTELFNKAGLFYSRRIGSQPEGYYDVEEVLEAGEEILSNPYESQMINATKISGRTSGNLGIGIFNAMTSKMEAVIVNEAGEERYYETNPFTNYNMLVFDQIIGEASYFNITNTNVYQPSEGNVADVLGTAFKFTDNTIQYAVWGNAANSYRYNSTSTENPEVGQNLDVKVGKINGEFRYNYGLNVITDTYNPYDMGYIRRTNRIENTLSLTYGKYEPTKRFLNWSINTNLFYNQTYESRAYTSVWINSTFRATLKNFISGGIRVYTIPFGSHNYDETRTTDHYFLSPAENNIDFWASSDYRKQFALNFRLSAYTGKGNSYKAKIEPRLRINDKLSFSTSFEYSNHLKDVGYVTAVSDSILFGNRNRQTVISSLSSTYVFSNKSAISLNFRHYWAEVDYTDYFVLNEEHTLDPFGEFSENYDTNFNTVNIDLIYSWNFAPGSFMSVMWKNSILDSETIYEDNFLNFNDNLLQTFTENASNIISLKVIYFLDYHTIKRRI